MHLAPASVLLTHFRLALYSLVVEQLLIAVVLSRETQDQAT